MQGAKSVSTVSAVKGDSDFSTRKAAKGDSDFSTLSTAKGRGKGAGIFSKLLGDNGGNDGGHNALRAGDTTSDAARDPAVDANARRRSSLLARYTGV